MTKKLCDICGEKEAIVYIKVYIDQQINEKGLCPQCAIDYFNNNNNFLEAQVLDNTLIELISQMQGLISGIVQSIKEIETKIEKDENNINKKNILKCKNCNTTYEQYKQTGYLGCPYCFKYFKKYLDDLALEIHRGIPHKGKFPERFTKIYLLKKQISYLTYQLNKLVQKEEYEEASRIKKKLDKLIGDNYIGTKNGFNRIT